VGRAGDEIDDVLVDGVRRRLEAERIERRAAQASLGQQGADLPIIADDAQRTCEAGVLE
jgi:hypothetical protein